MREIIESVVKEVVSSVKEEREKAENGKVLFVFCDSTAHEAYENQFIELKANKVSYDILFLDGDTSSWLGMNKVESSDSEKVIAASIGSKAPLELSEEYDFIVIPEIDLDNAARIAAGLKGSIKSEIVFSALLLNKKIFIGNDVTGIKRADRSALKTTTLPKPYKKVFEKYLKDLSDLGIEFISPKKFSDLILKTVEIKDEKNKEGNKNNKKETLTDGSTLTKKLLTPEWIKSQSNISNNTINIYKATIISPLAKDMIKEKGLNVRYID